MIKISVLYPNQEGKKFDMDYYFNKHIPRVRKELGTALKGIAIEQGLSGIEPGSRPLYIVMGHMFFDSIEAFQTAFGPLAEPLLGDIPNYTDIQYIVQISEVKV